MNERKKRSGISLREEVFMKKLLAVALSLCLLCSFALAEETPELSWENSLSENPNLEANGSTTILLMWLRAKTPGVRKSERSTRML